MPAATCSGPRGGRILGMEREGQGARANKTHEGQGARANGKKSAMCHAMAGRKGEAVASCGLASMQPRIGAAGPAFYKNMISS